MTEQKQPAQEERKRSIHRSPNYPLVSLRKGVEHVEALYNKDRKQAIPVSIAHERWGYKRGGAAGNQCVAALKSYGLLEVTGIGDKRKVAVSEDAYKIILKSPDRLRLLRKAALSPPLHKEMWEHFEGELPQDDVIRQYLLFERNFNAISVDAFIARFKDTVDFAELGKDNGNSKETAEQAESESIETVISGSLPTNPKAGVGKGMRQMRVNLVSGDAVLYIPVQMLDDDFKVLRSYIDTTEVAEKARRKQQESKEANTD